MSKINSYALDWLTDGGFELGYDMGHLPEMQDMGWIIDDKIEADLYFNYSNYRQTHREFLKLTGRA